MRLFRPRPSLFAAVAAAAGSGLDRVRALIELGDLAEAERELAAIDVAAPGATVVRAGLDFARGDLLGARRRLETSAPEAVRERALVLGALGRIEQAIDLLGLSEDPYHALVRSELHAAAGEPAAASVGLPTALPGAAPGPLGEGEAARDAARLALVAGTIATERGDAAVAVEQLGRARELAQRAGSATLVARAESLLGEALADSRSRWRALRAVTRALDLVVAGRVAAPALPGIHFRAFEVYGMYGHEALARSAMSTGHHLVIQLASGIDERAWRETFLIDNRDCQRLVAAFKGEISWGSEVARG